MQHLSEIYPRKSKSQFWKSLIVLTHKMSEIIMLKSRKISDKNPKFTVWFVLPRDQQYLGFCPRFYRTLTLIRFNACPRFFQKSACHSCGNRTLYWHINVRNYYIQKGACKYIVQCHVSDVLGQMISQPNSTLQCVKKSWSRRGKDQSVSQKLQNMAGNKLKTHSEKSWTL